METNVPPYRDLPVPRNVLFQAWLTALRSGEYPQGRNSLKQDGKYCCFGVLCEVYRQLSGDGKWSPNIEYPEREDFCVMGRVGTALPPFYITILAGVSPTWVTKLAQLNDRGTAFTEIAQVIESTGEALAHAY